MVKLSQESKQRLQHLFRGSQFANPLMFYLGFRRGADPWMPEATVLILLWG
ncbi:mitochondrial import receptor subunit TOM7 homolog [Dromiciops gliroides]|uniref:mitochondrial import receptor subunit TOM7 homolog n=1 Tax=Dromiciops gliroides TaxID=33562 RepID=UPI001CC47B78|nr:mitochondrial import receptor subunit TOM7 homolog [Dromiciops gliroides]